MIISMKKVGTLTFHLAHNYGAMLQAYALQNAVDLLEGISCEIIDYRFPHIDKYNKIWNLNDYIQKEGTVTGGLKWLKRQLKGDYKRITSLHQKFDSFMRKDLTLSKKAYFSAESMKNVDYDTIIFGSDQIWNPDLTGGMMPEYLGGCFDNTKTKLVSYAASSGTDSIKADCKETALPLLKRFSKLGIREESLTKFLKEDYGLEAQTVIDPVFLLESSKWDDLINKVEIPVKEPFLLIYAFQEGPEIYELARRIARERCLKLVSVSYREKEGLDDVLQLTDCGPKEFVALIKKSDFICTTSFHGTAFSVIYEKNFYCIGHPLYSQRNYDLLKSIGLSERMVKNSEEIVQIDNCDYELTTAIVKQKRQEAIDFLVDVL